MPPKRTSSPANSGRQNKKRKITAARSISVQQAGIASGPSKLNANDSNGLPDSIDVEKFVESRSFEIRAMQVAMKNAKAGSTHRAWQELPRHLRRRAASHNVRRVPLRLRDKSRAEMDSMRRKALGRSLPKQGKNRRELRTDVFARRQKDKKWLETHLWHAKRMHMENMWGYRLAVQPTEKSFRPSHRASVHGSILHDASYYGLIELKGPQLILCRALEACCDPFGAGPASKRFLSGVRAQETTVYEAGSYPFGYIGPISVIWRAKSTTSHASSQPTEVSPTASRPTGKRKRKGKIANKNMPESHQPESLDEEPRTIWIRCHPAVFLTVLSSIKGAVSLTLDALKRSQDHSQNSYSVEIIDLRESINVFEITGPKSSQVIHGALTPTIANHTGEFKKFWSSLPNLQSTGSVPSNMITGFTVLDPRLNFPPKNARVHLAEEELPTMCEPWECFPSSSLAQSDIWDKSIRDILAVPRFKKKAIDSRRAQNSVPGTSLKPTAPDNRIPVLLVQRSVKPTSSPAQSFQHQANSDPNLCGWTVILPKGWGMPFLTSLIYTGTRVGGQRERAHQAFEAGAAYFPRDFPTSIAYGEFAAARAIADEERWKRKPPAKRVSWDKLSTLSPWTSAWRAAVIRPWLLRGPSRLLAPASGLLSEINALRRKRELPPLDASVSADGLLQGALVHVRVTLCGRGAPDDMAFIYALQDQEARAWAKAHDRGGPAGYEVGEEPQMRPRSAETSASPVLILERIFTLQLSKVVPSDDAVIGFVTSGNFSLSRGQGYAIGAISLVKFLEMQEQGHRQALVNILRFFFALISFI
ncbi:ribonucleases P/MRP protein subunit POP1-domain-containing protein [Russula brevipes]|nr:ribonucleases P/MRP protein subunit POP1-domain-containing protein [Russula brevipes]